MGRLNFYVLWSLRDAPRQFIRYASLKTNIQPFSPNTTIQKRPPGLSFGSKSNRRCFQVHVPLPLPKQLVIFGLGEWEGRDTTISVEVLVSAEIQAQKIGTLSSQARCLTWEGVWHTDIATLAAERGRRGVYGKIVLTVCGEDKTPRRTVISKRGHLTWSSEDMDSLAEDIDQASTPKKKRLSRMNSQEEMTVHIKNENREVSACPSKRWSHTMCLSDPDTAVLIGGETADQNYCKDSLWKLELDSDFWFPMNSSASGPVPLCARGHSATYDPDSKSVFVYGGLREGQRYSEMYILNTLTWKWKLVTAKGNVPTLAYHSAAFYKKELFVFGGVQPSHSSGDKSCSNALYIFNPEFELWYQPIVEGDRPLPRFGHSATLLSQRLIIFGGRKTAAYLNDLHVLDLGFMEYTAVKCGNMPPLPRGFHGALPVSDNRILVSGGCSAIGALQDVHIFSTDTNMWSSVSSPVLCSKPRAGHSIISLGCSILTDTEKHEQGENIKVHCTLLVFGGSDCSGTFYNDTVKCTVEVPGDK
ncbi:acyl-CoA-binding domain-containing protein 4-like isoform X1 [Lates japonicus]|uniref:Acyl-CoA-binding domain-containing protein 4-like isoform X1 n=1 Tax=Lates japonicus TaxID=270547 RepID=A0AAD3MZB1_LATJO|nr:acyl-CoA-binding domain-containing protein 4-like isoform X1 [Lates japonicus]